MTRVVQHEPEGLRDARMAHCRTVDSNDPMTSKGTRLLREAFGNALVD
jgi:hypothetical protein